MHVETQRSWDQVSLSMCPWEYTQIISTFSLFILFYLKLLWLRDHMWCLPERDFSTPWFSFWGHLPMVASSRRGLFALRERIDSTICHSLILCVGKYEESVLPLPLFLLIISSRFEWGGIIIYNFRCNDNDYKVIKKKMWFMEKTIGFVRAWNCLFFLVYENPRQLNMNDQDFF